MPYKALVIYSNFFIIFYLVTFYNLREIAVSYSPRYSGFFIVSASR